MEIAGFVVALLAVVVAGWSALYARGANTRADIANERSKEALDLQKRIDDREREFRDVAWALTVEASPSTQRLTVVRLTNIGLTSAVNVTLVVEAESSSEAITVGPVNSGQFVTLHSEAAANWFRSMADSFPLTPPYRVHWSSPLGQVQELRVGPETAFQPEI